MVGPLKHLLLCGAWLLGAATAVAQPAAVGDVKSRDNFMVVVREAFGANKPDEALQSAAGLPLKMPDGRAIVVDVAAWAFIGDTQIRFVFDAPDTLSSASRQDLAELKLATVDEALALALSNLKRVYGAPASQPWAGGLMEVVGGSSYLTSSYFLDRAYWRELLNQHPDGIVVAVPKRGGLLWVPLGDTEAVDRLKRGIAELHASSGDLRVSSALYLFKDDRWSLLQAAHTP